MRPLFPAGRGGPVGYQERTEEVKVNRYIKFAVFVGTAFPVTALAYLDPGTGSMLLQVILGGIAAVAVAFKLYWHKLRAALGMAKKEQPEDESA